KLPPYLEKVLRLLPPQILTFPSQTVFLLSHICIRETTLYLFLLAITLRLFCNLSYILHTLFLPTVQFLFFHTVDCTKQFHSILFSIHFLLACSNFCILHFLLALQHPM